MSTEVKDPFQILADELTLVRHDLDRQGNEFKELKRVNAAIVQSMTTKAEFQALAMSQEKYLQEAYKDRSTLREAKDEVSRSLRSFDWHVSNTAKTTIEAYVKETIAAVEHVTVRRLDEFQETMYSRIDSSANRIDEKAKNLLETSVASLWRHKLGMKGVIIASLLLGFGLSNALNAYLWGYHSAKAFGDFPALYCGVAQGQRMEVSDKSEACVFWLSGPAYEAKMKAVRDAIAPNN